MLLRWVGISYLNQFYDRELTFVFNSIGSPNMYESRLIALVDS